MAMPVYTVTITGDSIEQVHQRMIDMLPEENTNVVEMDLEQLLLYTDGRCQVEGYEMLVTKKEQPAPPKKLEPKSKLKSDLEASVKEIESKKVNGHSAPETDDQRKKRCVEKLQALFAEGHKNEVRKILKEYGDGAKNFHGVAVERFAEIDAAIQELGL
jgi:hypothetical protein